jgi:hypothetical protein
MLLRIVGSSWPLIRSSLIQAFPHPIHARSSFPIDNVKEFPGVLGELDVRLPLFIDRQLTRGVHRPRALVFVGVIQLAFASLTLKDCDWVSKKASRNRI